jgi:hypothetical protein
MPGTRNTRATVHDRCLQRCCSFLVKCEGADSRVRISQTVRDQRKSQCSVHCQAAQSSETVEISVDKSQEVLRVRPYRPGACFPFVPKANEDGR